MQKQETFFKREVIIELSQMFNHFGPGTEIDQQIYEQKKDCMWAHMCIWIGSLGCSLIKEKMMIYSINNIGKACFRKMKD